jgi:hypothetical protein
VPGVQTNRFKAVGRSPEQFHRFLGCPARGLSGTFPTAVPSDDLKDLEQIRPVQVPVGKYLEHAIYLFVVLRQQQPPSYWICRMTLLDSTICVGEDEGRCKASDR